MLIKQIISEDAIKDKLVGRKRKKIIDVIVDKDKMIESEVSDKVYKKVAKELLDAFIKDQIVIIGEFSGNMEQSYKWLNKEVIKYAERLDENVDEWVKRIKAAREGSL